MQSGKYTKESTILVAGTSSIDATDVPTCLLLNIEPHCQLLYQHQFPVIYSCPPFLFIFHTSLVGLHTWVSYLSPSLPLSVSVCFFPSLSVARPCRRPLLMHQTPATALANLTHSDTAASKHLIFSRHHMSTSCPSTTRMPRMQRK